ncbi:MAG TPA: branched-chain amino acid ABC transporter substrate-binding protein [Mycobacteriales bacterium]|jgi:branched-chain amino acid transport system substrate-binding protein|nr:branched-chain amino acid ABC transporter substrate-binding protein [Mycobacteriales bacterium]
MQTGRTIRLVVPLAAAALAAAACGSSSSGGNGSNSGGSTPTFTIAYQGPLSGGNQQLGLNMSFAVKLAVNQANAGTTFGKLPFKLAFAQEDDQGTDTAAPAAVAKVLQIQNLIAVVGPAFSGATAASEPTYSKAGVATVSPSATNPTLATSGWNNFFRVVADDNAQGPADALYMGKTEGLKKAYVIDDASSYGAGLAKAFLGAASSNGLTVVKHDTAPASSQCVQGSTGNVQQYGPLAQKVKASGADSVFYAGYYCDFALLAKQLRSAGFTGQMVSDDGSNDAHYVSQAGTSVANGTLLSCACQETITSAGFTAFAPAFKALAGFPSGTYSAEAYDAANSIIDVMKEKGASVTKADVISGLHATGFSYQGISKDVKFAANGNYAGSAVYMYKVVKGVIKEIGLIS